MSACTNLLPACVCVQPEGPQQQRTFLLTVEKHFCFALFGFLKQETGTLSVCENCLLLAGRGGVRVCVCAQKS